MSCPAGLRTDRVPIEQTTQEIRQVPGKHAAKADWTTEMASGGTGWNWDGIASVPRFVVHEVAGLALDVNNGQSSVSLMAVRERDQGRQGYAESTRRFQTLNLQTRSKRTKCSQTCYPWFRNQQWQSVRIDLGQPLPLLQLQSPFPSFGVELLPRAPPFSHESEHNGDRS